VKPRNFPERVRRRQLRAALRKLGRDDYAPIGSGSAAEVAAANSVLEARLAVQP
jgi:hypothetical protein